jgi:diaminopimelate epimerase
MPTYGQYDVPKSNTMVNMGVGQPDNRNLPLDLVKKGMAAFIDLDDKEILQYGDIPGYPRFREKMAKWLSIKYQNEVDKDEIFMTNGNTQAVQILMNEFIEQEDTIIVEDPSYFIMINIFKDFNLDIEKVQMEKDGADMEELEEIVSNLHDKQKNVFFYTIPFNHNPTGYNMSEEKKLELARICENYDNFYVISDEVYHFLSWEEIDSESHKPLADYHDHIISCGSFSKILAPSLRLGWIYSIDDDENSTINSLKESSFYDSTGGTTAISSFIVEQLLDNGDLDKYIEFCKEFLHSRCDAICDTINVINEGKDLVNYERPTGGYFVWLNTNEINSDDLLEKAIGNKVKFHQGWKFTPDKDDFTNYIRLSFSFYDEEDLKLGTERLMQTIKDYHTTKVMIQGSNGRLGSLIRNEIDSTDKFKYIGNISRDQELPEYNKKDKNVIIDVSHADGTNHLIAKLYQDNNFVPIIIGTTGNIDMELINEYSKNAPVALISNFSDGIPKIIEMTNLLNTLSDSWNFKIIESHHTNKKDKPSGTAITLANHFNRNCNIESIREGEVIGEHKIVMTNGSESITLEHKANDRNIFAKGCIKFINWILVQKPGIYYKNDLVEPKVRTYSASGNIIMIVEHVEKRDWKEYVLEKASENENLDGVIFVKRYESKNAYTENHTSWNYYNRDGNSVPFCGNGVRCIGKYLMENYKEAKGKLVSSVNQITNFDVKEDQVFFNSPDPYEIEINKSENSSLVYSIISQFDFLQPFSFKFINVGVPHLVIETEFNIFEMDDGTFNLICSELYKSLNKGFNINFITVNDKNSFSIRTFERGVDRETGSCGSGTLSSFYYLVDSNKVNENCTVNYKNNNTMKLERKGDLYLKKYYLGGSVEMM